MNREVRYEMVLELIPLITKWWEAQEREDADIPYIGDETFILMAESAVNILLSHGLPCLSDIRRNK